VGVGEEEVEIESLGEREVLPGFEPEAAAALGEVEAQPLEEKLGGWLVSVASGDSSGSGVREGDMEEVGEERGVGVGSGERDGDLVPPPTPPRLKVAPVFGLGVPPPPVGLGHEVLEGLLVVLGVLEELPE